MDIFHPDGPALQVGARVWLRFGPPPVGSTPEALSESTAPDMPDTSDPQRGEFVYRGPWRVVERAPGVQGAFRLRLAEVADRTTAEALRGAELVTDAAALPPPGPRGVYHHEVLGMVVTSPSGAVLGRVVGFEDYGAGDLIRIADEQGTLRLLPWVDAFVRRLDPAAGVFVVDPPPGLWDEDFEKH